jgi:ABC-2 type transport system permease protein
VNLFRAEVSRLVSRRLTAVMLLVIAGLLGFIAAGFGLTSTQPTTGDREQAASLAAAAQATWDSERTTCLDVERGVTPAPPGVKLPPNCDYGPRPTEDQFLQYGFNFSRQWKTLYYTAAIILGLFGFVIGASFVGAEWTSGGMTNLLLWRPQRTAVLGAKFAVAVLGVLVLSIAYVAVWTGVFLAVAASSGTVGTMSGALTDFVLTCVRVVLLGVVGTAIGFSLASLGRHTAVALGVGIAYLLVYELGTLIIFSLIDVTYPERFRLSTYVVAWLVKRYEIDGGAYTCNATDCFRDASHTVTWGQGGAVLGLVAAALVVAAFVGIRRRDVA